MYEGSVVTFYKGRIIVQRVNAPFVYSVIGIPRTGGGFLSEWWVTGPLGPVPWIENKQDRPALLIHLTAGINCTREDFDYRVQEMFDQSLEDLAFASAMSGGIVDNHQFKRLDNRAKKDVVHHALWAHAELDHFSAGNKVIRTSMQYQLLRDMGVDEIQKTLALLESLEGKSVSAEAINQRIAQGRKLGLLPAAKSGRTKSVSSEIEETYEQNQEKTRQRGERGIGVKRSKYQDKLQPKRDVGRQGR